MFLRLIWFMKYSIHLIFRQWGFHHYLNELFTAPDAVMRYLCQNYRLHQIPVGNDYTQKHADEVPRSLLDFDSKAFLRFRYFYEGCHVRLD